MKSCSTPHLIGRLEYLDAAVPAPDTSVRVTARILAHRELRAEANRIRQELRRRRMHTHIRPTRNRNDTGRRAKRQRRLPFRMDCADPRRVVQPESYRIPRHEIPNHTPFRPSKESPRNRRKRKGLD